MLVVDAVTPRIVHDPDLERMIELLEQTEVRWRLDGVEDDGMWAEPVDDPLDPPSVVMGA